MIQAVSAIQGKKVAKKKIDNKPAVPTFQANVRVPHDTFVKGCKK